jgi:hypothetical protein
MIYMHAHIHTYINRIRTHTHTCVHYCMHAFIHIYMHGYIRTYIHTYMPLLDGLVVSVLSIGHNIREFKPGRGRWIFNGDKIPKRKVGARWPIWHFRKTWLGLLRNSRISAQVVFTDAETNANTEKNKLVAWNADFTKLCARFWIRLL